MPGTDAGRRRWLTTRRIALGVTRALLNKESGGGCESGSSDSGARVKMRTAHARKSRRYGQLSNSGRISVAGSLNTSGMERFRNCVIQLSFLPGARFAPQIGKQVFVFGKLKYRINFIWINIQGPKLMHLRLDGQSASGQHIIVPTNKERVIVCCIVKSNQQLVVLALFPSM